jgi:hypothetical protein
MEGPELRHTEDTLMSEREERVLTKQFRIAETARNFPEEGLTALAHHMDMRWLWVAMEKVRKSGAPGVDGVTAAEYEKSVGEKRRL